MAKTDKGQQEPNTVVLESEVGGTLPTKKPIKKKAATIKKKKAAKKKAAAGGGARGGKVKYPKDSILDSLRIPQAIIDQNAGEACTDREGAGYAKIGWTGETAVEISSALKYGLLERPSPGQIKPTDLTRKIVRPQDPKDKLIALRQAVMNAPVISEVYTKYRSENLPDSEFLVNTLVDSFSVPRDQVVEFIKVFTTTLKEAELLEELSNGKFRVLDVSSPADTSTQVGEEQIKKLSKGLTVAADDACFVMMPFANPIGGYYDSIYKPAIEKAKLKADRADADLYGTGKIIDQIWKGITSARVLLAELTNRNANVLYELGLAHALHKPVILVCSKANEGDVPFDLRHVRVIYYDKDDPFWGTKLLEKVAENILSVMQEPKDAVLFPEKK
ncbi:hypothetical protein [Tunturiibacter gelidiferens]|uniref:Uncharacterized protein n=1 Tax=Tunturiibacter gelidiferens TaxID=3069689 RepID=A0AAU7YXJ7_9BACT